MNAVHVLGQNRLLALLAPAERERLLGRADKVTLEQRTVIYEAEAEIHEVLFPLSGMVSLVISSEEGQTVEIGTIGNEGMVGTQVVLGDRRSQAEAVIQVKGDFLRMARAPAERHRRRRHAAEGRSHHLLARPARDPRPQGLGSRCLRVLRGRAPGDGAPPEGLGPSVRWRTDIRGGG